MEWNDDSSMEFVQLNYDLNLSAFVSSRSPLLMRVHVDELMRERREMHTYYIMCFMWFFTGYSSTVCVITVYYVLLLCVEVKKKKKKKVMWRRQSGSMTTTSIPGSCTSY